MPIFEYAAFSKEGKKKKGLLEAANQLEAKDKIREMSLLLTNLKQKAGGSSKKINSDSLVIFTSQLNQLISAKIPLFECLLALEEQCRGESFHSIVLGLSERVKSGISLSKALHDYSDSFSPLYRALIAAGEAIGNLELSLSRLTYLLTHQQKVRKQIISSLTYPFFLFALLLVAITILVTFVIPSLEVLFEDRPVPLFTQIVLETSRFLRMYGLYIIGAVVGCCSWFFYRLRDEKNKASFQKILLKIPFVSSIVTKSALSRFSRTLSTLLEGGLPLTNALSLSAEAIHYMPFEQIILAIRDRLMEGRSFSQELLRYPVIPPLFSRMVKIGEDSGKLSPLLSQLATMYEEETERTLDKIVTLTQPILLLLMGVFIGGVLLSILLPLSDFGSTIEL